MGSPLLSSSLLLLVLLSSSLSSSSSLSPSDSRRLCVQHSTCSDNVGRTFWLVEKGAVPLQTAETAHQEPNTPLHYGTHGAMCCVVLRLGCLRQRMAGNRGQEPRIQGVAAVTCMKMEMVH
ncbi:hypothetical protein HPB49_026663 [Dermacentor silvarum]|nr:hypothetical protein HPB49_026663 [Dermacentor silvarum]